MLLQTYLLAAAESGGLRCRGSAAGLIGGTGKVKGEGETERLQVEMLMDVRALVLGRVTPSLAAISRTRASIFSAGRL